MNKLNSQLQRTDTALHDAAWNGREGVVQTLLKGHADVNATNKVCDQHHLPLDELQHQRAIALIQ